MFEDRLQKIMRQQWEFQQRTPGGVRWHFNVDDKDVLMEMIRTQVLALENELHEALGEAGWKPWASSRHLNVQAFQAELIDAFRFLMNLWFIAGLTPDDVAYIYQTSLSKTNARVENGYDGVSTKCPRCKRAYDDNTGCTPTHQGPDGAGRGWCAMYCEEVDTTPLIAQ